MKQLDSFHNNELIVGIAILAVLQKCRKIEISKALLIQPILSYKGIIEFLKNKRTKVRSIEELIVKKNIAFTNFNTRYLENLEVSINSIFLFRQLGLLTFKNNELIYLENYFDFCDKTLGNHALDIIAASYSISDILKKEDASNLYLSLRVEL